MHETRFGLKFAASASGCEKPASKDVPGLKLLQTPGTHLKMKSVAIFAKISAMEKNAYFFQILQTQSNSKYTYETIFLFVYLQTLPSH